MNKRLSQRHLDGRELSVFALHRRRRLGGQRRAVVVQNWQDLAAEEGNSSLDMRHKVSGTYLYELPFGEGQDGSQAARARTFLKGFRSRAPSLSPPGRWLTPSYTPRRSSVACGTAGTLRPNLTGLHRSGRWRLAEAVVQSSGVFAAHGNAGYLRRLRQCAAQLDRGAGNGSEQHVAFKDDADGRYAQHGDSRHHQQCLQHRAVLGRGYDRWLADIWQVTSVGAMRSFQFHGADSGFSKSRWRS